MCTQRRPRKRPELARERPLPFVACFAKLVEQLGGQVLRDEGSDLVSPSKLLGREVVAHRPFFAYSSDPCKPPPQTSKSGAVGPIVHVSQLVSSRMEKRHRVGYVSASGEAQKWQRKSRSGSTSPKTT